MLGLSAEPFESFNSISLRNRPRFFLDFWLLFLSKSSLFAVSFLRLPLYVAGFCFCFLFSSQYPLSTCFPYRILFTFASPPGLSCRTVKLHLTFILAKWCKEKQFQETLYFNTHLPRDVREVSSFEAQKGTVEGTPVEQWMGYVTALRFLSVLT